MKLQILYINHNIKLKPDFPPQLKPNKTVATDQLLLIHMELELYEVSRMFACINYFHFSQLPCLFFFLVILTAP